MIPMLSSRLLVSTISVIVGGISLMSAQNRVRPKSGVDVLESELARFDEMIRANEEDYIQAVSKRMIDGGAWLSGKEMKAAWGAVNSARSLASGDRLKVISELATLLSKTIETAAPHSPVGAALKTGRPAVGWLVKAMEISLLTHERQQLLAQREQIFHRMTWERGRDPGRLAEGEKLLRGYRESLDAAQRAFRARHQDLRHAELAEMLRQAQGSEAARLGLGVLIVDPGSVVWDIEKIPGLNPDFVTSLRRQVDLLKAGRIDEAAVANRYSPDQYIPAFKAAPTPSSAGRAPSQDLESALKVALSEEDKASSDLRQARERADVIERQCFSSCKSRYAGTLTKDLYCMIGCQDVKEASIAPWRKSWDEACERVDEIRRRRNSMRP